MQPPFKIQATYICLSTVNNYILYMQQALVCLRIVLTIRGFFFVREILAPNINSLNCRTRSVYALPPCYCCTVSPTLPRARRYTQLIFPFAAQRFYLI